MRTAFIDQLVEEAKTNQKIFLLVGDIGFGMVEPFAKLFPERFINVGIAEQNMAGIAAGLALEGYSVFMYSIGNFPTLRCMEQIRYDICYHNLNVKIVASGSGFAYGSLGASHHATEDIGMLRTIPNLIVCSPGDPIETKAITSFFIQHKGPGYMRLGRAGEPNVHKEILSMLSLGEIIEIQKEKNVAIFSAGSILKYVCDFISENKIKSSIYSFPFIKPIDKNQLLKIFKLNKKIITIEEHQADGGFGSAILEIMNDLIEEKKLKVPPKITRISIGNKFYSIAGSQDYLRKLTGIQLNIKDFKY